MYVCMYVCMYIYIYTYIYIYIYIYTFAHTHTHTHTHTHKYTPCFACQRRSRSSDFWLLASSAAVPGLTWKEMSETWYSRVAPGGTAGWLSSSARPLLPYPYSGAIYYIIYVSLSRHHPVTYTRTDGARPRARKHTHTHTHTDDDSGARACAHGEQCYFQPFDRLAGPANIYMILHSIMRTQT